jgi:hypothetical protein
MNWLEFLLELVAEVPEIVTEIKVVATAAHGSKVGAAQMAIAGAVKLAAPFVPVDEQPEVKAVAVVTGDVLTAVQAATTEPKETISVETVDPVTTLTLA